jgi:hypothetical protein
MTSFKFFETAHGQLACDLRGTGEGGSFAKVPSSPRCVPQRVPSSPASQEKTSQALAFGYNAIDYSQLQGFFSSECFSKQSHAADGLRAEAAHGTLGAGPAQNDFSPWPVMMLVRTSWMAIEEMGCKLQSQHRQYQ